MSADADLTLVVEHDDVALGGGLWQARQWLQTVQQAAHARQRAPQAVLGAVLARIAAGVDHTIKLPAVVGSPSPLCMFVLTIGPSGVGKGSTYSIARDLLPLPGVFEIPQGSGEGLVEALFGVVEVDGKPERQQIRHNIVVYIDEGETLTALGHRSGNTVLQTLRSIWSGQSLGAANASKDRTRIVPAGQYTYGIVMGLQEERAGQILGDAPGGTPQRFLWTPATDRFIPAELPPSPSALHLQLGPATLDRYAHRDPQGYMRHHMGVPGSIEAEIRRADLAVARGELRPEPLLSHGMLLRLRVAGLLALVERRMDVTDEDWQLAGLIKSSSDAAIARTRAVVEEEERKAEKSTGARRSRVEAAAEAHRIVLCAERVQRMVLRRPGITVREFQQNVGKTWRDDLLDGLDHALGAGWVVERSEPGRGRDKRTLHPPDA